MANDLSRDRPVCTSALAVDHPSILGFCDYGAKVDHQKCPGCQHSSCMRAACCSSRVRPTDKHNHSAGITVTVTVTARPVAAASEGHQLMLSPPAPPATVGRLDCSNQSSSMPCAPAWALPLRVVLTSISAAMILIRRIRSVASRS